MMNRKSTIKLLASVLALAFVFSCVLLTGCSGAVSYSDYTYMINDVYLTLKLPSGGDKSHLDEIASGCASAISDLVTDLVSSTDRLNSEINVLVGADAALLSAIETSQRITESTGGVFDYTAGALLELWENGSSSVPSKSDISYAQTHTGRDKFKVSGSTIQKLDKIAKMDFGGIIEGLAVQSALEYLSKTDVKYAVVSYGATAGVYGDRPGNDNYVLALCDPLDTKKTLGNIKTSSGFVSVCGDYMGQFEFADQKYHETIDLSTGYPSDSGLHSVAVITSNGPVADALSSVLLIMGEEKAKAFYESSSFDFEAVMVTDDGRVILTPGIGGTCDFTLTSGSYKTDRMSK